MKRITVQSILELLNQGLCFEEIIRDYYPDLQVEDIRACLLYAIALVAAEDIRLAPTLNHQYQKSSGMGLADRN